MPPKPRQSASACTNGDFICIETCSGTGLSILDPLGVQHRLPVSASDLELGTAVLDALAHSRTVPYDGDDLYDLDSIRRRYEEWVGALMAAYRYHTRRTLFEGMKRCAIRSRNGLITILPSHHDQLEGWNGDGISEAEYVSLPESSPPSDVGSALRLAFSRCT